MRDQIGGGAKDMHRISIGFTQKRSNYMGLSSSVEYITQSRYIYIKKTLTVR